MKKVLLTLLALTISMTITAQDKVKEKLKNVTKENVSKISITTSEGVVEFSAEEAKELVGKMKSHRLLKKFNIKELGDEGKVLFLGDDDHLIEVLEDGENELVWHTSGGDKMKKNIKVEKDGDNTKVTITTNENGEEKVEVLEGEEAEKFLEEQHKGTHFNFSTDDGEHKLIVIKEIDSVDCDSDDFVFFFDEDHGGEIDIKVDVEKDGDEMKVKVKKIVDGEETIEEYVGEDAEKFIKEHEDGKVWTIKLQEDCGDDEHVIIKKGKKMLKNNFNWSAVKADGDIEKKIEVTVEDGVKKVTVTTTEDGKEKVETYEGDEADEFLEKMRKDKKMNVMIKGDKDKKKIKKIIIEKKIEKEEE